MTKRALWIAMVAGLILALPWSVNGQGCRFDVIGPRSLYTRFTSSSVVGDLDGDGMPDLVWGTYEGMEVRLNTGEAWFIQSWSDSLDTGALALGDFDGDGNVDLCDSGEPQPGAYAIAVFFGNGDGTFNPAVESPAPSYASRLLVAELNGDGWDDLIVDGAVRLGNGDGTFQPALALPVAVHQTGDLNGDGNQDLVGADAAALDVILGNGDGTFQPPLTTSCRLCYVLAIDDFDGDGLPDVFLYSNYSVDVFPGNGDGTLQAPRTSSIGLGVGIAVGDLDGDGTLDVAFPTRSLDWQICTAMGKGDGTFQPLPCHLLFDAPDGIELADLDADGRLDYVIPSQETVIIGMGDGYGTFEELQSVDLGWSTTYVGPLDIAAGDLNGDGLLDAITADNYEKQISVLLGDGAGGFSLSSFASGGSPQSVALSDLDADSIPDIAVINEGVGLSLFRGAGDGTFQHAGSYPANSLYDVAAGDLDADGMNDLVVTDRALPGIQVLMGGIGAFAMQPVPYHATSRGLAVADLDQDGFDDVALADHHTVAAIVVLIGNGDGTFQPPVSYPVPPEPFRVIAVDLDQDGLLDLVTADFGTPGLVTVLPGQAGATFGPPASFPANELSKQLAATDWNGDGAPDLLTVGSLGTYARGPRAYNASNVSLLSGNGSGSLEYLGGLQVVGYAAGIATGDFNRDGAPDALVPYAALPGEASVAVLLNQGIRMEPPVLPRGDLGTPYSATLSGRGGTAPYEFSLVGGLLPPGLSLSPKGVIGGIPTARGLFSFTVEMTDAGGCRRELTYAIQSGSCAVTVTPDTLPAATYGALYRVAFSARGGQPPYTFQLVGTLPSGLVLSLSGVLSGIPLEVGTFPFDVEATDVFGCKATISLSLDVGCASIVLSPPSLPEGAEGRLYRATIAASGGKAPYSYTLSLGATLPPGLLLDSATGTISGMPTAFGDYPFTALATDSLGCRGSRGYAISVAPTWDYVLGRGPGPQNPNRVRIFSRSGTSTLIEFDAYAAGGYGVNVAAGGIDGDPVDEILTGPGPGPVFGPEVRAFRASGLPLSKVDFYAYATLRYGVNVAGGDIDGDGFSEILSGPGPADVFGPHLRGFDFDGSSVRPIAPVNFFAYKTLHYGVNPARGDVDGDGFAEILTGVGPGPTFAATVRGFDHDGGGLSAIGGLAFDAFPFTYGVRPAGGDIDSDGFSEIAAAAGPGPFNPARFKGFDYDAGSVAALAGFDTTPFATLYGGRIALGDMTGSLRWDLLAGAGPDPSAPSDLLGFAWDGTSLLPLAGTPIVPFPPGYGVSPGAGALGL